MDTSCILVILAIGVIGLTWLTFYLIVKVCQFINEHRLAIPLYAIWKIFFH